MSRALEVVDLRVTYPGPPPVRAVDDLCLSVAPGQCLGILGESGSGKSTTARALLGLVEEAMVEGRLHLGDLDLAALDEEAWRSVRWKRIAMSFQATTSLNPVLRVSRQLTEPLDVHLGIDRRTAQRRAVEQLAAVGLGEWAMSRYPGELSGGQRRLVLLAMALVCDPEVLILDEPTAGLDPVTRDRVLGALARFQRDGDRIMLVLGHDAEALETVATHVAVMYRGWLAEVGPASDVLARPRSPYTWALLNARPTLASVKDLRGIRGDPPDATSVAVGCPFLERCAQAVAECDGVRPPVVVPEGEDGDRRVACARGGVVRVLTARGLRKTYKVAGRLVGAERIRAVDGIDLDVRQGEVVGLVGPTGAGKSTLAMLLAGLLEADEGVVEFEGLDLSRASRHQLKAARGRLQLLFQDPFEAVSPRMTIGRILREPLEVQGLGSDDDRVAAVRRTLVEVRLPHDGRFLARYSHQLSGGQLQRVALARALLLQPNLLVADEPVSMLDPSEQANMLQLLKDLQVNRGMSMVLVSHDLATVLRIADRVIVLHEGAAVEEGTGSRLLIGARHPVTRSLLLSAGAPAKLVRCAEPPPTWTDRQCQAGPGEYA